MPLLHLGLHSIVQPFFDFQDFAFLLGYREILQKEEQGFLQLVQHIETDSCVVHRLRGIIPSYLTIVFLKIKNQNHSKYCTIPTKQRGDGYLDESHFKFLEYIYQEK